MADEPEAVLGDATDEVQENNLSSDLARKAREDKAALVELLKTKNGRGWFRRLMEFCGFMGSPFFGEETHSQARAYGREEVGRKLFVDAQDAGLELYLLMVKEGREDEARLAKEAKKRADKAEGRGEAPLTASMQGPELDPPPGWPGHKSPVKPIEPTRVTGEAG